MKKLYIGLLAMAALTPSCVPDMDLVNPNAITTESFYKNEAELEKAVNGAYNILQRNGGWGRYMFYTINGKGDDYNFTFKSAAGMKEVPPICNYTVTADNFAVRECYEDMYVMVFAANLALEKINEAIDNGDVESGEFTDRLKGEAYFLRGLAYYYLTMNFGEEIPYRDHTPKGSDEYFIGPEEKGLMYNHIVDDFILAEDLLPLRSQLYSENDNVGRATKGSAQGYLAKTYMCRPVLQLGSQADWTNAKLTLERLFATNEYELMHNFRDNHTEEHENNNESLFEAQFYNNESGGFNSSVGEDFIASWGQSDQSTWRQQEVGMLDASNTNSTWWNMQPTVNICNEFETDAAGKIIDPRYAMSIWGPDGAKYSVNGTRYTTYTSWLTKGAADPNYGKWFGTRKYCGDVATTDWETGINDRLLRYSDILLMYAECVLEVSNDEATAAEYINKVRSRANNQLDELSESKADKHLFYVLAPATLPTVQELIAAAPTINGITINTMRRAIKHERKVELFAEGWRFFDLLRWSLNANDPDKASVMDCLKNKFADESTGYGYADKNMYMPIPAEELSINYLMKGNCAN